MMTDLLFAVWEAWDGPMARNRQTGEVYIGTRSKVWLHRLEVWRSEVRKYDKVADCPCPSPVPAGHIMFNGRSSVYEVL
jgi:hypothetical protein